jgi:solute carrier family 10 (sodium/bile acid cotransporter), member 7
MKARLLAVLKLDPFLIVLIATVALASVFPVHGQGAVIASDVSYFAVVLLFFLHGAKLSTEAVMGGIRAWPIHLITVAATFIMFPVYSVGLRYLTEGWLNPAIGAGLVLLAIMPATVQSSIAFTSIARGNVPAAVCSASASSILGVVLTPFLAALLLSGSGGSISFDGVYRIMLQLLVPFIVGHLMRPLILGVLNRYKTILTKVDRSVILLVVYTAFSAAVAEGLWHRYSITDLLWTLGLCVILLIMALVSTTLVARLLRFNKEDEITIVFCGSKKSLVSGVPIASALFPPAMVGPMILPLMLFHQLQLMACAVMAQRYAKRGAPDVPAPETLAKSTT